MRYAVTGRAGVGNFGRANLIARWMLPNTVASENTGPTSTSSS